MYKETLEKGTITYLREWSWRMDNNIIINGFHINGTTMHANMWLISSRWHATGSLAVWDRHTAWSLGVWDRHNAQSWTPLTSPFSRGAVQVKRPWNKRLWKQLSRPSPLRNPPSSTGGVHSVAVKDTGLSEANGTLYVCKVQHQLQAKFQQFWNEGVKKQYLFLGWHGTTYLTWFQNIDQDYRTMEASFTHLLCRNGHT